MDNGLCSVCVVLVVSVCSGVIYRICRVGICLLLWFVMCGGGLDSVCSRGLLNIVRVLLLLVGVCSSFDVLVR